MATVKAWHRKLGSILLTIENINLIAAGMNFWRAVDAFRRGESLTTQTIAIAIAIAAFAFTKAMKQLAIAKIEIMATQKRVIETDTKMTEAMITKLHESGGAELVLPQSHKRH